MPLSQVLTKRRVKRRQQRQRIVSKNAKRNVRSVRKHRKTAKKVMRGGVFGFGPKTIYYSIMYDRIPIVIDSNFFDKYGHFNNKINYILPIFITVMVGDDLYFFFNKNMTSEVLTILLKTMLGIKPEVILDPPIELPAVSADYVVPTYNGIPIPNIENIKDIGNKWTFDDDDLEAYPSYQLVRNLFHAKLEDPFQHISKRFIKFKKTRIYSLKGGISSTFENVIYSGEISDTIPLDEIKESSLTKHTFTSPTSDVVTAGFKTLFETVKERDGYSKLQQVIHYITYSIPNPPLETLYGQYIPTQNNEIELKSEPPEKTHYSQTENMTINISQPPQRMSIYNDIITTSALTAKNILNSINDSTASIAGRIAGTFTPLPPGWFVPRPSADTSIPTDPQQVTDSP